MPTFLSFRREVLGAYFFKPEGLPSGQYPNQSLHSPWSLTEGRSGMGATPLAFELTRVCRGSVSIVLGHTHTQGPLRYDVNIIYSAIVKWLNIKTHRIQFFFILM